MNSAQMIDDQFTKLRDLFVEHFRERHGYVKP